MTEHNPTHLDPAAPETPETDHPSFVDNGADDVTPDSEAAAETAPQTGSGSIPTESGEDNRPESGSEPPQTGLGDEPDAEPDEGVSAAEVDPQTGSGSIATESGEDSPPESGSEPPQTGLGDESAEADSVVPAGEDSLEDHLPPGQTEVPVGDEVVIDDETMRRALEAILMVTDEPLPVLTLARAVGRPTGDVAAALGTLAEEYTEQGRGFDLREVGGGWRYYTRVEAAPYVERFVLDGQQARLTQAALETLAVVAYKQPVSRARVSAIRGVNVDGVMRTLIARGLVEEAGADTESQATLYRTTSYFLERMGMQSLDDLPELAPYLPDMDDIEDELAAQTIPPATPEEPTESPTEDPTAEPTPAEPHNDAELDDEAEPGQEPTAPPAEAEDELSDDDDEDEPAEADELSEAEDGPAQDEPAQDEPAQDEPADDVSAEDGTGIDGDLSTDEPVELDVEHEPGDLEPADEVGSTEGPKLSHSGDSSRDE